MNKEIERKFLVKNQTFKKDSLNRNRIVQGYLNSNPKRAVRVRITKDSAYLTIKGIGNNSGTTRFEWEKEISIEEANYLLDICEKGIVEKYRYRVNVGRHTYEIDEFLLDNKGLLVAEVELQSEDEIFEKPKWLGNEVTGEIKYYNSELSKRPYTLW